MARDVSNRLRQNCERCHRYQDPMEVLEETEGPDTLEFRRDVPLPAPVGSYHCTPCDEVHYPGEPCHYDFDYSDPEDDRALAEHYPEWSGAMQTYLPDEGIFTNEEGEER
jgi:hypothetical protein